MSDVIGEQPGKAEIRHFDAKVVVKENVVSLDITVDNVRSMEIGQCACGFYGNAYSDWP